MKIVLLHCLRGTSIDLLLDLLFANENNVSEKHDPTDANIWKYLGGGT